MPSLSACLLTLALAGTSLLAHAQATSPADTARTGAPAARPDKPSFIPLPGPFYSPETKLGVAIFVAPVFRVGADTATRKSTSRLLTYYTQEKQWSIQLQHSIFTPGERYVVAGDWRLYDYPIYYYGTGDRARDADKGLVQYKLVTVNQRLLRRVGQRRLFVGGQYALASIWDIDTTKSVLLSERPAQELRPNTASGLGPVVLYDTRDRLTFPARGVYAELSSVLTGVGGTWHFQRYTADLRRYFGLNATGTQVVAVQLFGQFHAGQVPFRELAQLGGISLLRGFYEGRYRDRQLVAAQAEYRRPIWRRIGLAVFGGVGDVGYSLSDMKNPRVAGGAGLRFQFNRQERLNVRADYGVGTGGSSGFYFSIGEAF